MHSSSQQLDVIVCTLLLSCSAPPFWNSLRSERERERIIQWGELRDKVTQSSQSNQVQHFAALSSNCFDPLYLSSQYMYSWTAERTTDRIEQIKQPIDWATSFHLSFITHTTPVSDLPQQETVIQTPHHPKQKKYYQFYRKYLAFFLSFLPAWFDFRFDLTQLWSSPGRIILSSTHYLIDSHIVPVEVCVWCPSIWNVWVMVFVWQMVFFSSSGESICFHLRQLSHSKAGANITF